VVRVEELHFAGCGGGEEEVPTAGEEAHLRYGGAGVLFPGEDVLFGNVAFEVVGQFSPVDR
jgi:hypothetical protein